LAGLLLLALLAIGTDDSSNRPGEHAENVEPLPVEKLSKSERQFCDVVSMYAKKCTEAEDSNANEIKLTKIEQEGVATLSHFLRRSDRHIKNWIATVDSVGTTPETGRGTLRVVLPCGLALSTSKSEVAESIESACPIEPHTSLFDEAANLKGGQAVTFSGDFVSDWGFAFNELSGAEASNCHVDRFEYLFKFDSLSD
jgi:hypothetical protein